MSMILKITIVLLFGFIFGKIAKKYGLPSVSGYLIGGLFLGPSLFGMLDASELEGLIFISEIALAVIAFSIGSEFLFSDLKKVGKAVLIITLLEAITAVFLVFFVMFVLFNQPLALSLVVASMSASTAPAATMLVIRQYRARGPLTKTILPVVALDDIVGIVLFGIALSIAKILTSTTTHSHLISIMFPIIEIIGSLAIGFVLGILLSFVSKKATNKDEMLIITLIAIGFAIGLGKLLEFSPLLINIAMGTTLINFMKQPLRIFSSVNDFIGPFYVLFFALAGASLHLEVLRTIGWIGIAYIFARGLGKYIGAYTGAVIVKSEPQVRNYLGLALLPQGGIAIGLSVIVRQELPIYAQAITTIIMFSVLIYETTGPIFAKIAIKRAKEISTEDETLDFQVAPQN